MQMSVMSDMSHKRIDLRSRSADFREVTRVSARKVANRSKETQVLLKKVTSSKESARKFLVKTGVYTKKGNLTAPYR